MIPNFSTHVRSVQVIRQLVGDSRIKSAGVAKCTIGLFASIVAENLQDSLPMLRVVLASQFDS